MKPQKTCPFIWVAVAIALALPVIPRAEESEPSRSAPQESPPTLVLVRALMCEGIKDAEPQTETIVFSATLGQAVCFTAFDPVLEKTDIYHNWFRKDRPEAKFKLTLKPPRWATYSKINLHHPDAGPWRVEITDSNGNVLKTLRFSVTE